MSGAVAACRTPFGRIGRVAFLLLTVLLLAVAFGCFYAGMHLSYDLHVPAGMVLVWVSVALLLGVGALLAARRCRDMGAGMITGIATMLPRAGWMVAITRIQIFSNDGWFEVALALLALDILILLALALAVWPGQPPGQTMANRHGEVRGAGRAGRE